MKDTYSIAFRILTAALLALGSYSIQQHTKIEEGTAADVRSLSVMMARIETQDLETRRRLDRLESEIASIRQTLGGKHNAR